MATKKVRKGVAYVFEPAGYDIWLPPKHTIEPGTIVIVTQIPGAPPPNTMGHAHVTFEDGTFAGLVDVRSLQKEVGRVRRKARA